MKPDARRWFNNRSPMNVTAQLRVVFLFYYSLQQISCNHMRNEEAKVMLASFSPARIYRKVLKPKISA